MTPDKYLTLQFKKTIHRNHVRNAEMSPTPTEELKLLLEREELCLVLVQNKREQRFWFTNRRLLRQDSSTVIELFSYKAVQKVHWMAKENPFDLPKAEYFDRLEIDTDDGEVVIDGLGQAYFPLFKFLQFVAKNRLLEDHRQTGNNSSLA